MRLWQDRLVQMLPPTFTIIKTTQLVGLFQCIIFRNNFVIRELAVDLVKTGLGGYHGNKVVKVNEGAIISRFLIGDSSICFVNSHLAAHQSHTSARNNDIQQILKETNFAKINSGHHWEKGGDGSSILVINC